MLVFAVGLIVPAFGCGEGLDEHDSTEDIEMASGAASSEVYRWKNVKMGGTGFVTGLVAHPKQQNLIYARTDVGGAYRWDETTGSWVPLTDWVSEGETTFLGVESIALDPSDPKKVYLLAGTDYWNGGKTGILRSSDYGKTFQVTDVTSNWKAHGNGSQRGSGERLAVDPNKGSILFCGSRKNGLWKSTDSGATWTSVSSFPVTTTADGNGIDFVVLDPSTGTAGNATRTIFVGVSRSGAANIYRSTDAGATWAAVPGAPAANVPYRATIAGSNLYVTYGKVDTANGGTLFKLSTGTNTWTDISPFPDRKHPFGGISVDPSNPQRILVSTAGIWWAQPWGYGDWLYLSENGGSTWRAVLSDMNTVMDTNGIPWIAGAAVHWASSVLIDPYNTKRAFVVSGNGIFGTTQLGDATTTWKFQSKGLEEAVPLDLVSVSGGPLVSVIGDYDGFANTDPAVYAPSHGGGGTHTSVAAAETRPNTWVRAGDKLRWTDNAGGTWAEIPRPTAAARGQVALSADGAVLLYQPSDSTTLYRTTNKGVNWTTVSGIAFASKPAADTVNTNKFYMYNSATGAMWVSTNGGASFVQAGSPGSWGGILRTTPGIEGDVWVPMGNNGLMRSSNSGTSFSKIASVSSASGVSFGKTAPGKTFPTVFIWGSLSSAPSGRGIFRSIDAGATWTRVNDDAHEFGGMGNGNFIVGDRNVYGRVYMSTAGRGIVYGELSAFQFTVSSNINPWWIQVSVESPGNTVTSVTAKINDQTYAMSKDDWGSWVLSRYVPPGTQVLFTATNNLNNEETFSSDPWPN
ncbi:exo-alpha-sialidase [Sorangium sp. So ce1128]